MLKYLTELLSRPVFGPDGAKVGRVHDAIAGQVGRLPTLSAIFIRGRRGDGWVGLDDIDLGGPRLLLRRPWADTPRYAPADSDLRLQRDILDKQIVDVHDYRVVRVNDVRLAACGDRACVIGVDAGFRAILRRTGVGKPVEALARLVGKPLRSHLIAWDDVETLEPGAAGGGRIKLKVPHDKIAALHPADIADIIEQLDPQQRTEVIEALDVETAADTIEEMEDEEAAAVMQSLPDEKAADILDEMDPDAAADILADLTDEKSEDLLEQMEPEEAADVKELLAYPEETAGGMMTPDFIDIPEHISADETIALLRRTPPEGQSIYYLYVVDDDRRLVGVLSLRDLIVAEPSALVSALMTTSVRYVHTDAHADEIAQTVNRYNLLALPVLDDSGRLTGIVTVDDMLERILPPDRRRRLPQVSVDDE